MSMNGVREMTVVAREQAGPAGIQEQSSEESSRDHPGISGTTHAAGMPGVGTRWRPCMGNRQFAPGSARMAVSSRQFVSWCPEAARLQACILEGFLSLFYRNPRSVRFMYR